MRRARAAGAWGICHIVHAVLKSAAAAAASMHVRTQVRMQVRMRIVFVFKLFILALWYSVV